MAANFKPSTILLHLLIPLYIILSSIIPNSFSQPNSPQNIQTFYPLSPPPPPPPPQPQPTPTTRSSTTRAAVGRAIGITAASTLILTGLLYLLLLWYNRRKKNQTVNASATANTTNGGTNHPVMMPTQIENFTRFEGNVKGLIVDENGLDVLYWRKLEEGDGKNSFKKEFYKSLKQEQKEEEKRIVSEKSNKHKQPVQEAPLLRGKSSTSQSPFWGENLKSESSISFEAVEDQDSSVIQLMKVSTRKQPSLVTEAVSQEKTPPSPPPPVAIGVDLKGKMAAPSPLPLAQPSSGVPPKGLANKRSYSVGVGTPSKAKLKPLWDKVNPYAKQSMAVDKIDKGSTKYDGDIMEALFGYVATNRKSPKSEGYSPSPRGDKQGPPSQIFILDAPKSQNTAMVLKSLGVTRKEIIDALIEGKGLIAETIEKLAKIAPTDEETSKILAFDGDPLRLADAESFLYYLLKAVPSAFTRFNAMLFMTNYDSQVSNFKDSLKSVESACNELGTRGLFLKLLEAVLKAGNQLNATTTFTLAALKKLSDVKSSDGKTTLLQFVVQELVRAEGKRCVRNKNTTRGLIESSEKSVSEDDQEREYMMLGLPIISGLSNEFSNVKKAALLDYDLVTKTSSALAKQVTETRQTVTKCCGAIEGFARTMNGFLDTAELEMNVLKEEETRVMELVQKTADHYQIGSLNNKGANSLQLFVMVNDFMTMVDQVCVEIARNVQSRKIGSFVVEGSSLSGSPRVFRFPKLPANFMSDCSNSGSDKDSGVRL